MFDMKNFDLECFQSPDVVCPNCGFHIENGLQECFSFEDIEDSAYIDCPDCKEKFYAERGFEIYYSIEKMRTD